MNLETIQSSVSEYYRQKLANHGPVPQGVDWNEAQGQELRFEQLLNVCRKSGIISLNDYGCGYGALCQYLERKSITCNYTGYDWSPEMIAQAQKLFAENGSRQFTSDRDRLGKADYTIASGIFNVKLDQSVQNWETHVIDVLHQLNRISLEGFAFNMLTSHADAHKMRGDLFYADPSYFLNYCLRHFSRSVSLLHDYGMFEFTILVHKTDSAAINCKGALHAPLGSCKPQSTIAFIASGY